MTLNRWWQKVVSVRRHLMWATLWKWIVEVKVCDTGRKSFNCTQRWPSTSIKSSMRVTTSSEWVTRDSAVEGTGDWWSEHVNVVDNYRYVDRNPKRHSLHTHLHLCPTSYRWPLYKFKKCYMCYCYIHTHSVEERWRCRCNSCTTAFTVSMSLYVCCNSANRQLQIDQTTGMCGMCAMGCVGRRWGLTVVLMSAMGCDVWWYVFPFMFTD